MTLLEVETGDRLDYRGFQRRVALADGSAGRWDTRGFTATGRYVLYQPCSYEGAGASRNEAPNADRGILRDR